MSTSKVFRRICNLRELATDCWFLEMNGAVWFRGKDFAKVFRYENPKKAVQIHVSRQYRCRWRHFKTQVAGAPPKVFTPRTIMIKLTGLYTLLHSSSLAIHEMEKFCDWLNARLEERSRDDLMDTKEQLMAEIARQNAEKDRLQQIESQRLDSQIQKAYADAQQRITDFTKTANMHVALLKVAFKSCLDQYDIRYAEEHRLNQRYRDVIVKMMKRDANPPTEAHAVIGQMLKRGAEPSSSKLTLYVRNLSHSKEYLIQRTKILDAEQLALMSASNMKRVVQMLRCKFPALCYGMRFLNKSYTRFVLLTHDELLDKYRTDSVHRPRRGSLLSKLKIVDEVDLINRCLTPPNDANRIIVEALQIVTKL